MHPLVQLTSQHTAQLLICLLTWWMPLSLTLAASNTRALQGLVQHSSMAVSTTSKQINTILPFCTLYVTHFMSTLCCPCHTMSSVMFCSHIPCSHVTCPHVTHHAHVITHTHTHTHKHTQTHTNTPRPYAAECLYAAAASIMRFHHVDACWALPFLSTPSVE